MKTQIADTAHSCSLATLTLRGFILLAATLAVTACATGGPYQLNLMPAPDVYDDGAIDPFTDTDPIEKIPYSGILYATNRAPAVDEEGYYLNQRGGVLRLGAARIQLGKEGVTWEEARQISLAKNRTDKYPLKVTEVEELGILDRSGAFFAGGRPLAHRDAHRVTREGVGAIGVADRTWATKATSCRLSLKRSDC